MKTTVRPHPSYAPRALAALVLSCLCALSLVASTPAPAHADLGFGTPVPLDPSPVLPAGDQSDIQAAGPDSLSLFVWVDERQGEASRRIFGARVRPDGTVLDKNGIEISSGPGGHVEPTIAWDGAEWLVVWSQVVDSFFDVELRGMRVKLDGTLLDPSPIEITNDATKLERNPALAWVGSKHVLVWSQTTGLTPNTAVVVGLSIDADGTVHGPVTPLPGLPNAIEPAAAALGSTALVAWAHADSILAVRVGLSGGPNPIASLNASPIVVSSSGTSREEDAVVAASSSNNEWLVGWTGILGAGPLNDVFARRVAANGTLPGPALITVAGTAAHEGGLALIAHDSAWLAGWTALGQGTFVRSVPANGNPPGTALTVSSANGTPRFVFGGDPDSPLFAWAELSQDQPGTDVHARRVVETPQLSLEPEFLVSTQTPNQTQPALAFSGARWMAAWVDDRFGPTLGQIRVAFTDSAKLAPPTLVPIAFAAPREGLDQAQPAAAFDGTNFTLLWSEERGGYHRIVGARFTPGGAFIDTFTVSSGGSFNETEPALAVSNAALGEMIVVWSDDRAGFSDRNLWQATIKNGAVVVAEGAIIQGPGHDESPSLASTKADDQVLMVYQLTGGATQSDIRYAFLDRVPFLQAGQTLNAQSDHVFQDPKIAFNGEDWMITYQEVVDNDGPFLHVPMVQYFSSFYGAFGANQVTAGSYAPSRPVVGSAGYTFVTMFSELQGAKTDVHVRSLIPSSFPPADGPLAVTNDTPVDIAGAAEHGLNDRVGMTFMRTTADDEWIGTRLFAFEAQDTLAGRVVINEFLAHPPSDHAEFFELFNVSGRTFRLNGWKLAINGVAGSLIECFSDAVQPGPNASEGFVGPGGRVLGSLCGDFPDSTFDADSTFSDFTPGPEGFLPDRSGKLQLYSPQGVLVDQVAYGDSGAAPVSGGIPTGDAPRPLPIGLDDAGGAGTPAPAPATILAVGDSIPISTSRVPNGADTDNDGTDFNLTTTTTAGGPNSGTAAAPGTAIFFTRVYAKGPPGADAVEFFNPSSSTTFDFTNWYLSDGQSLERIGSPNNAFGILLPGQKKILRQGDPGSFTFGLDYDDVLYLYDDQLARVEQIAWWRDDLAFPDACQTRVPDTGGTHTGFSWITAGGQQNLNAGEVRYTACAINAPQVGVGPGAGSFTLTFAGAVPNPARVSQGAVLAYTVPGVPGPQGAVPVRVRVYDVTGRLVATPVDAFQEAGEQRVSIAGAIRAAGVYYAELDVAGQRVRKSVVLLP